VGLNLSPDFVTLLQSPRDINLVLDFLLIHIQIWNANTRSVADKLGTFHIEQFSCLATGYLVTAIEF